VPPRGYKGYSVRVEVAEKLDRLVEEWGVDVSEAIARLLEYRDVIESLKRVEGKIDRILSFLSTHKDNTLGGVEQSSSPSTVQSQFSTKRSRSSTSKYQAGTGRSSPSSSKPSDEDPYKVIKWVKLEWVGEGESLEDFFRRREGREGKVDCVKVNKTWAFCYYVEDVERLAEELTEEGVAEDEVAKSPKKYPDAYQLHKYNKLIRGQDGVWRVAV